MNNLVDKWINISSVGFWEPIPNIKIQTSSKVNKKIGVKSANELITVNPMQQGLVWQAELSFELSLVAYSLANHDGSLRKGVKVVQQLTASTNPKVVIIHSIAVLQMTKSSVVNTFGELSEEDFNIFSALLFSNNCLQVHMIFEQCWVNSIKGGEFQQRKIKHPLASKVQIRVTANPVPRQCQKKKKKRHDLNDIIQHVLYIRHWFFRSLDWPELWFHTKVNDKCCFIPVHDTHALGDKLCSTLLGFHTVTGCDWASSLASRGKKKAWHFFCCSFSHQDSLSLLMREQDLSVTIACK